MDNLRLYLLGIGILILLAIYFHGRKKQAEKSHDIFAENQEQTDILLDQKTAVAENSQARELPDPVPVVEERIEPLMTEFEEPTEENDAIIQSPDSEGSGERIDPLLDESEPGTLPEMPSALEGNPELDPVPPMQPEQEAVGLEDAITEDNQEALTDASQETETAEADSSFDEIVVMYLVAPDNEPFEGPHVMRAFHVHKLRFGDMNIYHRQVGTGESAKIRFSIASMLNPGTLIPTEMNGKVFKGLTLFMRTESVDDPQAVYDDMLHVAQHLANTLKGELRNNQMQQLTQEDIAAQRNRLPV